MLALLHAALVLLAPAPAPAGGAAAVEAAAAGVADTARQARATSDGWRPLVVVDEVSVAIETQTIERTVLGARVTALLRWDYRARAASPTAWDAGARAAFGVMQFDCGNQALRTRSWTPVDARGERVEALVVHTDASADAEEWVRPRAASMGGRILAAVCRAPEVETTASR